LRREHQRTLRAVDQLDPQPQLQLVDRLAGRRLRNAILDSPPGEASPAHHIAEDLEGLDLHRIDSLPWARIRDPPVATPPRPRRRSRSPSAGRWFATPRQSLTPILHRPDIGVVNTRIGRSTL